MTSTLDWNNFFDTYQAAVLTKDVDRLMSIYANDFVAFDMWNVWSHGEDAWRDMVQEWLGSLGSETVGVAFDDIRIIPGDDVSAAHATITFKAIAENGAVVRSMQNRLTWVATRTAGDWKIVHQHTSAPIEDATMKARLHR